MRRFNVPGMSCGHCRAKIEEAILGQDDLAELEFDMEARVVSVDAELSEAELGAAFKAAGFDATAVA